MSATFSPGAPTAGAPANPLVEAGRQLDRAVGRFEYILAIGLGVSLLTLILDAVRNTSFYDGTDQIYGVSGSFVVGGVLAGIATAGIVLLVFVGFYFGITGLIAWRRGVWALRRAGTIPGLPVAAAVDAAVRDDRRTWMAFALAIALAIGAGIVVGISDASLLLAGLPAIPGPIASLVVGLVAGTAVILIYWYGTRHLIAALAAISPPYVTPDLLGGQNLVLAGAVVGWVGAFSSIFWPLEIVSALGILLVLLGIERFHAAYSAAVNSTPPPRRGVGLPAA